LPKICESIDGTYTSLVDIPNKRVSIAQNDCLIRENYKKFHDITLQRVQCLNKCFWNVRAKQPISIHDGGQFKVLSLYKKLKNQKIFEDFNIIQFQFLRIES
jgi:hypothetical protein